ncbi:MAG TPA: hypothetical protein DCX53_01815, partial [Anaerolineae bacterium]|nr:hypothetical protein [Anaerolineae bacterium]
PEQKRDLDLHLRSCVSCSALAETGKVLKAVTMVPPVGDFTMRFQARLAKYKIVDRRRKIWGTGLFLVGLHKCRD